jgi:hypothetical protein
VVDAGGAVETCKLCGILVNRSYQEAHDRTHVSTGARKGRADVADAIPGSG